MFLFFLFCFNHHSTQEEFASGGGGKGVFSNSGRIVFFLLLLNGCIAGEEYGSSIFLILNSNDPNYI
jgi:hypothetical protein